MPVFCSLCGREFDTDAPDAVTIAWCECVTGIVDTTPTRPARHR